MSPAPPRFVLPTEINRRDAMRAMISALEAKGVPDAAHDARLLLCAAAQIDHAALIRDPDLLLETDARERIEAFMARRLAREPVTRILGERGFWSLDLEVAPNVLDPRPDSETLIDAALAVFGDRQNDPIRVADLGCGSGALLCALLDVFPSATGVGVDLSADAVALTNRNLRRCQMSTRGRALQADWSNLDIGRFDLIVSNPPYIASAEIDLLDPEVREYDPRLALDGGTDGLDAYRSLTEILSTLLTAEGAAILEMGAGQRASVEAIFQVGDTRRVEIQIDLSEIERAIVIRENRK